MSKPSVIITGTALTTSLGRDRETTWANVLAGRSGFGPMPAMESPLAADKDGAQAVELPDDFCADLPREARYLRWTIAAAVEDARLFRRVAAGSAGDAVSDSSASEIRSPLAGKAGAYTEGVPGHALPYPAPRCAIILGTTLHGMRAGGRFLRSNDFGELRSFNAGATLKLAAGGLPFGGPSMTICSACSSSLGSIALGVTLLQSGAVDCVIAGGYDTISEYVYGGFNSLRLVADGPLRPFARDRKGMKLAEGYGIVVLERADDAAGRGATSQATILGWGESADAHHLTQPHPQGAGAAAAITSAMSRAQVSPQQVDLIAAHATGTPDNDAGEFAALASVFGTDLPRVPVVGFKSHLGHTLGGAGAVELILSCLALRDQIVPACANVRADELAFEGLNVATGVAKPASINVTLNTSLGFGGANTCVVLGKTDRGVENSHGRAVSFHQAASEPSSVTERPFENAHGSVVGTSARQTVVITGLGVVAPGMIGVDALLARIAAPPPVSQMIGTMDDADLDSLLNARRTRRMSQYVKLQLASAALAVRSAGLPDADDASSPGAKWRDRCCAILGTAHGGATYSYQYYSQIVHEGIAGANPMLFAEGVPNAGAAHISLMLGLKGACQSVIGSRTAGLDALSLAAARIAAGEWERAIVGAGEENCDLVRSAYQNCGMAHAPRGETPTDADGFLCGSGGVAFVLESADAAAARGAKIFGQVDATASARADRQQMCCAAAAVLRDIGSPGSVIVGASGSWLDKIEFSALRHTHAKTAAATYGWLPECFSVNPLVGLAATLASGRLPQSRVDTPGDLAMSTGEEAPATVGVLTTDPSGTIAAARVSLTN